ncbi:unnamed protein product [Angiostrongylus costaricensis]|uniref:CMD domain-containing protein n=1 Tax=Angiostrongylus costaricensis TaxID=334426 RepID=A0A158PLX5_ANGCS|nr:unnamed protein product [Angiostrongylus costaricensis]
MTTPPNEELFPKENLDFAESITKPESEILKEVFEKYACFNEVGEMIDAVTAKSPELGKRMRAVLNENCVRLDGMSPTAVEYSKKVIHFVTHVMCSLTLGKQFCFDEAVKLHNEFQKLPAEDQAALKKRNPDVEF